MNRRTETIGHAALAFIGPMIWAVHFFLLYLMEALVCVPALGAGSVVRIAGGGLTVTALIALVWVRASAPQFSLHSLARPLIDLSIVAVVLTAIPLLLISPCRPA